jgi:hypothetical protein
VINCDIRPRLIGKFKGEGKTMKSPNYGNTEYRPITIKTTDGSTIHGKVNLAYKQRVSDLFTKCDTPFLIMVDVMSKESKGRVMFVNKEHIVWAEPEE